MAGNEKALASILGKMSPAEESEPEQAEGYDVGLETAAGELIAAVEAKDSAAVATALKAFVEQCKP